MAEQRRLKVMFGATTGRAGLVVNMSTYSFEGNAETSKALQKLARESMKLQLLRDIMADMAVCEIEGWDKLEYLEDLRHLIDSIGGQAK